MVLTHTGAPLSKMIRIQLPRFNFSDITKDVVVAMRECVYVRMCAQIFIPARWCATFGSLACCLHLNPQEMENGLQFLKLMLRSDSLKMHLFSGPESHCDCSSNF